MWRITGSSSKTMNRNRQNQLLKKAFIWDERHAAQFRDQDPPQTGGGILKSKPGFFLRARGGVFNASEWSSSSNLRLVSLEIERMAD